jgi:hypothetical protein
MEHLTITNMATFWLYGVVCGALLGGINGAYNGYRYFKGHVIGECICGIGDGILKGAFAIFIVPGYILNVLIQPRLK